MFKVTTANFHFLSVLLIKNNLCFLKEINEGKQYNISADDSLKKFTVLFLEPLIFFTPNKCTFSL